MVPRFQRKSACAEALVFWVCYFCVIQYCFSVLKVLKSGVALRPRCATRQMCRMRHLASGDCVPLDAVGPEVQLEEREVLSLEFGAVPVTGLVSALFPVVPDDRSFQLATLVTIQSRFVIFRYLGHLCFDVADHTRG